VKLVYIAGPYRAATPWDVEQNVRRAEAIGLEIARLGGMPVVPHSMCRFYDKQVTDDFWGEGTLKLMRRCDIVVMVPGWGASTGARGEWEEAARICMPAFQWATDADRIALALKRGVP
jgi:hypothetical protein